MRHCCAKAFPVWRPEMGRWTRQVRCLWKRICFDYRLRRATLACLNRRIELTTRFGYVHFFGVDDADIDGPLSSRVLRTMTVYQREYRQLGRRYRRFKALRDHAN